MESIKPFILKHRDKNEPSLRELRDSELPGIAGGGQPCGCDTITSTPNSDGGDDGQD